MNFECKEVKNSYLDISVIEDLYIKPTIGIPKCVYHRLALNHSMKFFETLNDHNCLYLVAFTLLVIFLSYLQFYL